jgi:murein DD-endopeptidase / murein LD-carboxypeptidase
MGLELVLHYARIEIASQHCWVCLCYVQVALTKTAERRSRIKAIFSWLVNRLDPKFLDIVDVYWSKFFGSSPDTLRKETAQVLAHAEPANYAGCYLMEFGAAPVISLPPDEVEFYREAVAGWRPGIVRMPSVAEAVFGKRVAAMVGPAFVGYCDPNQFQPVVCDEARPLVAGDEEALETLRAACEARAWEHGGSRFRLGAMTGVFKDQELVALASYQLWGERIAHIAVVTHPRFRGHGHATAAVSALTRIVFDRQLVPQYRTLETNAASMDIARRLGFIEYATSLAIRLHPNLPPSHDNAYECWPELDLSQSPIEISERFYQVCYNGKCYPGAPGVRGLVAGANCQQFAYEFVRASGYTIPALRSSGLWADTAHSATVEQPEPFDLVLLNGKPDPWGAHVGVYLGKRLVLHLCKKIGVPAIESLESLMERPKYRYLIGFKRILMNRNLEGA